MRLAPALPHVRLSSGVSRLVVVLAGLGLVAALIAAGATRGGRPAFRSLAPAAPPSQEMALDGRDIKPNSGPRIENADAVAGVAAQRSAAAAVNAGVATGAVGAVGAAGAAAPGVPAAAGQLGPLPSIDRMIVKTGALTLRVGEAAASGDALATAMQRINAIVAGIPGAYVAASSTNYRAETPDTAATGAPARDALPPSPRPIPTPPAMSATLSLRVPVDAFDQAMLRLRELGSPISEQVSTQEVTEEYVDLEAQVRNLEATEQQYLRFLERAQRIEEVLPIQQRLTEVRNQIERLRGRMTLLQRRSDVSTITVTLVVPAGKDSAGDEPRAVRTLREAWGHLVVALQGMLDVLIYVGVYALPLVPLVLGYFWWRRRQGRPGTPAAAGGAV